MKVYVISKSGKALMPTKPGRARKMLRDGKAKVEQRTPFTIRLMVETKEYTQPITLGIDAGSKTVGASATTEAEEVYSSETEQRDDIAELIATRLEYRRARRKRKRRYRKPRFQNRVKAKKRGWIAPSIRQKIESHLKIIASVCKILPISKIVIEAAAFDIQKIKNPEISGAEYQQGNQLDFWNVREYVLYRDGHKCQGKKGCANKILNVHHIESRKTGGDAPNNLITLCEECHNA
ncbi:MAG: RNA-guided endonuclease IscB, partial [Oscillospiraceae bacterium]|nr:RNA-guided endonuclease IscB [Oscillospiraceae bacterium]